MGFMMKIAGTAFIITFSIVEIVLLWHNLPKTFSFSEFRELNDLMPTITMITVFGFLMILGIVSWLGSLSKIVFPLIGLIIVFIEIGNHDNLISSAVGSVSGYLSGMGSITVFTSLILVAFGFILQLISGIIPKH